MKFKYTFSDFKKYASRNGYTTISRLSDFKDSKSFLKVKCNRCKNISIKNLQNLNLKRHNTCAYCNKKRFTFDDFLLAANKNGFVVLDDRSKYINAKKSLHVSCKTCGHHTTKNLFSMRMSPKRKCVRCGRRKYGFKDLKNILIRNGYAILGDAKQYVDVRSKIKTRCLKCGLVTFKNLGSLNRGNVNCRQCDYTNRSLKVQEIEKQLKVFGIKLASAQNSYRNTKSKLNFECIRDSSHIWEGTLAGVRAQKRCPICYGKKWGESIVRFIFETLLEDKFPTKRPHWLNGLELDGYSESMNLGFEYQGIQHYQKTWREKIMKNSLFSQRRRDKEKKALCRKQGVILIEIPEIGTYLPLNKLVAFVKEKLRKKRISIVQTNVDLNKSFQSKALIEQARDYAKSKNLILLSQGTSSRNQPLKWHCKKCGYEWHRSLQAITYKNSGCRSCAGSAKKSTDEINNFFKTDNIRLTGSQLKYKNNSSVLKWECLVCKYVWNASYVSLYKRKKRNGYSCQKCARRFGSKD